MADLRGYVKLREIALFLVDRWTNLIREMNTQSYSQLSLLAT